MESTVLKLIVIDLGPGNEGNTSLCVHLVRLPGNLMIWIHGLPLLAFTCVQTQLNVRHTIPDRGGRLELRRDSLDTAAHESALRLTTSLASSLQCFLLPDQQDPCSSKAYCFLCSMPPLAFRTARDDLLLRISLECFSSSPLLVQATRYIVLTERTFLVNDGVASVSHGPQGQDRESQVCVASHHNCRH